MKGGVMSPAQQTEQLMQEYHLALSLMQEKQDKLYWHDQNLHDMSQARMRLAIKQAKQNYQFEK